MAHDLSHNRRAMTLNNPIETRTVLLLGAGRVVKDGILEGTSDIARRGGLNSLDPHLLDDLRLIVSERHLQAENPVVPVAKAASVNQHHAENSEDNR